MATITRLWHDSGYQAELPLRIRMFLWLSTGMFRVASLAIAFMRFRPERRVIFTRDNRLATYILRRLPRANPWRRRR